MFKLYSDVAQNNPSTDTQVSIEAFTDEARLFALRYSPHVALDGGVMVTPEYAEMIAAELLVAGGSR